MEIFSGLPDSIELEYSIITTSGIKLSLFNTAAMHPLASGNKLFKLTPNLQYALENGFSQVLSFGGAFSNHIHALALYGQAYGLQTIGIIRGEPEYVENPTLKAAQASGMILEFVDRKTYRLRNDPSYLKQLSEKYPGAFVVPEGGSNQLAVQGCMELGRMINSQGLDIKADLPVDTVAVACGTGGTLSGLVCGLASNQQVLGFTVVRDTSLEERIDSLLLNSCQDRSHDSFLDSFLDSSVNSSHASSRASYQLIPADYGGYAKFDKDHLDFILDWLEQTGVLLDPIYTSKMCRKLVECIVSGYTVSKQESKELTDHQHIGVIHTGGLQAWYGMQSKVIQLGGEASWGVIRDHLRSVHEIT